MNPFKTRRPRRFNHPLIYSDERRERLRQLEEKARRQLDASAKDRFDAEEFRDAFSKVSTSRRQERNIAGWGLRLSSSVILILIVVMALVMYGLMSGSWLI